MLARQPGDATFKQAPANYHVFAAASVGRDAGVEALTLNFAAQTTLTRIVSKNKDFVIEPGGTCHEGNTYSRGGSCALLVRFNPQGPGHRLGFINVSHSGEAQPMSFGLTGNSYSPVVSFTPSQITTVPGTVTTGTGNFKSATSLAVDGGDTLYLADVGNNLIDEIDSSGVANTISPAFATPATLAVDTLGIIYSANVKGSTYYFADYTPWGVQSAFGYAYAPGSCTPSAPCAFSTVGMGSPANMSIDNYDDLFFEEATEGAAEMPVSSVSGGGGTLNLWYLKNQFVYTTSPPMSFAVDAGGNLYNSYIFTPGNACMLQEESLYSAEYSPTANRVAGGVKCGFTGDGGQARTAEISSTIGQIAFDTAGNLYFADAGNQRIRRIDAHTGIISTIAGNGVAGFTGDGGAATNATLSNPTGVAVDSQGQVYILSNAPTAGPTQAIRKVGTKGLWTYGPIPKGTKSPVKVFTVANTGNDTLTLSANATFTGTNPANFSIDPTTTTCGLTTGATLLPGRICKIGIIFTPSAGGARSGNLLLLDNTVTNSNDILLSGTGTLPAPTMAITAPVAGSSVKQGATVTFTASVTSTATTKPTGTVTFKVNGASLGSPVALSGAGIASTTFSEPTANTYSLSAIYSGDANYATATKSESLIVTTVKAPVGIIGTPVK
ncbi:MAG TPA: Ig-like domain repeat protein [Terracidiphilus sp.]